MNEETKRLFFLTFFFVLVEGLHLYKNEDEMMMIEWIPEQKEEKGKEKENSGR